MSKSQLDNKTIELLNLIDRYETLVSTDYRTNFINGFVNLSKANYEHNGRGFEKRYGIDSIDFRPRVACLEIGEDFNLIDLTEKKEEREEREEKKEEVVVEEKETLLKNRKTKKEIVNEIKEIDESVQIKDPILQFGVIVPNQLKQSHQFFKKAIENSIEVVKLQRKINTVLLEIEQLK